MKTINGNCPQFEYTQDVGLTQYRAEKINEQLREWAAARTCVKCKKYFRGDNSEVPDLCLALGFSHDDGTWTDPKTFSCAAFEEKK